ncbi:hypothetical protein [Lignipirellula cremea]|uniref:Uncharacterized protein n=1 Tax=Lignipirellula cremea TaxID=2528010 RepID=A0A518DT57_9BACT|nr:hypothetical protein [Lignipirellula cremea]QDU95036.1 hypothetical protein Pla8534_28470 [Lignipirellula cremea]
MFRKLVGSAVCAFALAAPNYLQAQESAPASGANCPPASQIASDSSASGGGVVTADGGAYYAGEYSSAAYANMQRRWRDATHPHGFWPQYSSAPWHGHYYHTDYGRPLALVVPPTASMQTKWSWGVGNTTSTPIYHQFSRQYPGGGPFIPQGAGFMPTPQWPSHTDQFGVYYMRGPW